MCFPTVVVDIVVVVVVVALLVLVEVHQRDFQVLELCICEYRELVSH